MSADFQIEGKLPNGRTVITWSDGVRDWLPPGTFEAPRFILEKRENHGDGYHAHVLMRNNGSYERTGYVVTCRDGHIFLLQHGLSGKPLFDIDKYRTRMINDLEPYFNNFVRGIPLQSFRPTVDGAIPIFKL